MKKKSKIRRKRISGFSLIILIFSITLVFFNAKVFDFVKDTFSFGKVSFNKVTSIVFTPDIEFKEDTIWKISNQGIIICEKNKFRYFDILGNPLWEKEINSSSPSIIMTKDSIVVSDMGTGDIFTLDYSGNIKSKLDGKGSIKKFFSSENGVIGIMPNDENVIVLYDNNFNVISRVVIPQGEVIDFDISSKKSLVAVSLIKYDESNFYSNIIIYKLDGNMVGATNFEGKYIYDIKIVDNNIVAILDDQIVSITGENEVAFSEDVDRIISNFFIDDFGNVILNLKKPREDITDTREDNVIKKTSLIGEESFKEIKIDGEISDIDGDSKYLLLSTGSKMYFFDEKTGEILKLQEFNDEIEKVSLIGKMLYIKNIDKINIYEVIN